MPPSARPNGYRVALAPGLLHAGHMNKPRTPRARNTPHHRSNTRTHRPAVASTPKKGGRFEPKALVMVGEDITQASNGSSGGKPGIPASIPRLCRVYLTTAATIMGFGTATGTSNSRMGVAVLAVLAVLAIMAVLAIVAIVAVFARWQR